MLLRYIFFFSLLLLTMLGISPSAGFSGFMPTVPNIGYGGVSKTIASSAAKAVAELGKSADKVEKGVSSPIQHTKHSLNRKINREVKSSDELDTIRNPLDVRPVKIDSQGRPSQRYVGEKAELAINPETGKVVSVNPTSNKKAVRLKRKLKRQQ